MADELNPLTKSQIGRNNSNNPPGRYTSIPMSVFIEK
jgi:hypothetical protein